MAGCVPCFVIPLLLFIFHRYIQPILLRFWNPWASLQSKDESKNENEDCKFSCECAWAKKNISNEKTDLKEDKETSPTVTDKAKEL